MDRRGFLKLFASAAPAAAAVAVLGPAVLAEPPVVIRSLVLGETALEVHTETLTGLRARQLRLLGEWYSKQYDRMLFEAMSGRAPSTPQWLLYPEDAPS